MESVLETVEFDVVTELDELNCDELRLEDIDMKVSEVLDKVEEEVPMLLDEVGCVELRLADVDTEISELLETTVEEVPTILEVDVEKVGISELIDTTTTLEELNALEESTDAVLEVPGAPAWGVELEEACPSDAELEEDVDATSEVVAVVGVIPPTTELELELEDVSTGRPELEIDAPAPPASVWLDVLVGAGRLELEESTGLVGAGVDSELELLAGQVAKVWMVSESMVIEPPRANTPPSMVDPASSVTDSAARMFPMKVEPTPIVALLPTFQKTFPDVPPVMTTLDPTAVIKVLPVRKYQASLQSPVPARVKVPVNCADVEYW